MKIGLLPVDSRHPNIALMKLSAWHKAKGDDVEFYNGLEYYDTVYMSKIFSFTDDYAYCINADRVVKGGTGYDYTTVLLDEIERTNPDYSLYGIDYAMGFLTRGCPNRCRWCIVPKKEGDVHVNSDIDSIANGIKKVVLLDNNFLALRGHALSQLEIIVERGYVIDFNQGLDARLVDDVYAALLAKVRWMKRIRFAADTKEQVDYVFKAIDILRKYGYKGEVLVYTILTEDIRECYERINPFAMDHKIVPFAQPYRPIGVKNYTIPQWQKDMARWVNKKEIFFSTDFLEYSPRKGFRCSSYFKNN